VEKSATIILNSAIKIVIKNHNIVILYFNKNALFNVCLYFKKHNNYNCLIDLWAVNDYMRKLHFEVNYLLLNIITTKRVQFKVNLSDERLPLPYIDSVSSLFNAASWAERETWDLFGIYFNKHRDLRRILTDYGFDGYPLRKDFPIAGYLELRYNYTKRALTYQSIRLSQEYRIFNFNSPWL